VQTTSSLNDDAEDVTLYCARYVFTDVHQLLDDACVAVRGTQIVAVGSREKLTTMFLHALVRDYGRAAITPGFVNAHTHLELTAMRNYLEAEEADFFSWLRKLTHTKYELLSAEDMRDSALWGAVEAVRAGVTCVGDASDFGEVSAAALRETGLRGIVFQEVFGPDESQAREQLAQLQVKVAQLKGIETALVRIGVSPHAPYTVSPALLTSVADYAITNSLPVMMHAAESHAETMLLRDGRGAFAESLARRGIAWHAPARSPIMHLAASGILDTRPLLAHCIQVDDADIEILAASGARVAHCPKSNLKLGHGRAPFAKMRRRGIATGLGSDSVASNNTCDMLEEARFATLLARLDTEDDRNTPLSARDALDAATRDGARALGIEGETGTLTPGLAADFTVINLDGAHQTPSTDPRAALIFSSSARDVLATVIAGREVFRDGHVTTVDEERLRARMLEIERKLVV
jgi:5-methylthioadenosine/S-adenosylhomocysteine deaminase